MVLGVATSALVVGGGGCSDDAFSQYVSSLVLVPKIHWWLSHLWAFLDTEDTSLSFCHQSHDPFTRFS